MSFLKAALRSLPGLLVALGSGALAWVGFNAGFLAALGGALGIGLFGAALYAMARHQIYRTPPKTKSGVRLLEWAVIGPSAVAAGAGAMAIWLAIDKTSKSSPQDKALITALVSALTTYLTVSFVDWSKDPDGTIVSDWAKSIVKKRFAGKLKEGSESQFAAQDDPRYDGWGRAARLERAKKIDENWSIDKS